MATSFQMEHYKALRRLCFWACYLSLFQSCIWIGLNIIGILLCKGIIWATNTGRMCNDSQQLLVLNCIYLAVSLCWLIITILILLNIKRHKSKLYVPEIIIWIMLALILCILDLTLSIIFAINLVGGGKNAKDFLIMMILIFKGFVLWLINVILVIALLNQLIKMCRKYGGLAKLLKMRDISNCDDDQATIDASQSDQQQSYQFDQNEFLSTAFNNDGFENDTISESNKISHPQQSSTPNNINNSDCQKINEDILIRIAHLSKEVALLGGYFHNITSYVQNLPSNVLMECNNFGENSTATINDVTATITSTAKTAPAALI